MTPKEALKLLDCQRNCRECGSYDRELYRCNEPTPYAVDCVSEALEELEQVKKENEELKDKIYRLSNGFCQKALDDCEINQIKADLFDEIRNKKIACSVGLNRTYKIYCGECFNTEEINKFDDKLKTLEAKE